MALIEFARNDQAETKGLTDEVSIGETTKGRNSMGFEYYSIVYLFNKITVVAK